ncbi:hypothetical protein MKEN_00976700 [Mycena kentingensis (nom. inval.)]|nr:hypothetical protein MKEN_00976700 [Mycena kentingensis (nom. inval.)]
MHPALRFTALAQLPVRIRLHARRALDDDFENAQSHVVWLMEESRKIHAAFLDDASHDILPLKNLLPVVFHLLDPISIPTVSALVAEDPRNTDATLCRVLPALQMLSAIPNAPPEVFVELWPRLWSWFHVIDCISVQQSTCTQPPERFLPEWVMLGALISMTHNLTSPRVALKPAHDTPGFMPFLGRQWSAIASSPANAITHALYALINTTIGELSSDCTSSILDELAEELVEGRPELARLIVDGMEHHAVPCDCCREDSVTIRNLVNLTGFACMSPPHLVAIRSTGVVSALTKLLVRIAQDEFEFVYVVDQVLRILVFLLSPAENYKSLPAALDAGLLKALLHVMRNDHLRDVSPEPILDFLQSIVPGASLHRRYLRILAPRMDEVGEPTGLRVDLREPWDDMCATVRQHLVAMSEFEAPENVDWTVCRNSECSAVKPRRELRVCAGCRVARYCNRDCQKAHWRRRHRDGCAEEQEVVRSPRLLAHILTRKFRTGATAWEILFHQLLFLEGQSLREDSDSAVIPVTVVSYSAAADVPDVLCVLPLPADADPIELATASRFGRYVVGISDDRSIRMLQHGTSGANARLEGLMALLNLVPEGRSIPVELSDVAREIPTLFAGLVALAKQLEEEEETFF